MVFHLYCICYTFVLDKYDDIFVSTLASFVSRQMLYQICLTFVFEPNTVKCMISSSACTSRLQTWHGKGRAETIVPQPVMDRIVKKKKTKLSENEK